MELESVMGWDPGRWDQVRGTLDQDLASYLGPGKLFKVPCLSSGALSLLSAS